MNPEPEFTSAGQAAQQASAGFINDRIAVTKDKARELAGQARDKMAEFAETAKSSAEDYITQGREFIRQNPAQGLLYALGAGFVVGWLLKR